MDTSTDNCETISNQPAETTHNNQPVNLTPSANRCTSNDAEEEKETEERSMSNQSNSGINDENNTKKPEQNESELETEENPSLETILEFSFGTDANPLPTKTDDIIIVEPKTTAGTDGAAEEVIVIDSAGDDDIQTVVPAQTEDSSEGDEDESSSDEDDESSEEEDSSSSDDENEDNDNNKFDLNALRQRVTQMLNKENAQEKERLSNYKPRIHIKPVVDITEDIKECEIKSSGFISSILNNVIYFGPTSDIPNTEILNYNAAICLEDKTKLGRVTEIIGLVNRPIYSCPVSMDVLNGELKDRLVKGTPLYYVVELTKKLLDGDIDTRKPIDMDEEEQEKYFSDDDAEREYMKEQKAKKKLKTDTGQKRSHDSSKGLPPPKRRKLRNNKRKQQNGSNQRNKNSQHNYNGRNYNQRQPGSHPRYSHQAPTTFIPPLKPLGSVYSAPKPNAFPPPPRAPGPLSGHHPPPSRKRPVPTNEPYHRPPTKPTPYSTSSRIPVVPSSEPYPGSAPSPYSAPIYSKNRTIASQWYDPRGPSPQHRPVHHTPSPQHRPVHHTPSPQLRPVHHRRPTPSPQLRSVHHHRPTPSPQLRSVHHHHHTPSPQLRSVQSAQAPIREVVPSQITQKPGSRPLFSKPALPFWKTK